MLPVPDTRAVICSAAPLPYPADAGTLGTRVPAASSQAPCRRRNPARPSAARCTKDNSVLWPETSPRLSRSLLAAGCPDPAPPPATQCSRQSLRHPSRQPLTPLALISYARAERKDHSASLRFGRGSATPARASLETKGEHAVLRSFSRRSGAALLHQSSLPPSPARSGQQGAGRGSS